MPGRDSRLRKHGLYAKAEKCEFHTNTTEYLGYMLSPAGLSMSSEKVKAVQEWPEPRKVKVSRPGIWDLLSQPFASRVDGLPDNSPSSPTRGPQGPSSDSLVHYFL